MNKTLASGLAGVALIAGAYFYGVDSASAPTEPSTPAPTEPSMSQTEEGAGEDSAVTPPDEAGVVYTLDAKASTLNWAAERIVGNSHTGTVKIQDGYVAYQEDAFLKGEFVIDMTTIMESNDNQMFLNHIRSDDFFTVEKYPTARIVVTEVEQDGEEVTVTGDLTIRGITNEISFPATLERTEEQVMAQAKFQIDRTKWGIVYDSGSVFKQLGDKAIRDEITYEIDLTLERE